MRAEIKMQTEVTGEDGRPPAPSVHDVLERPPGLAPAACEPSRHPQRPEPYGTLQLELRSELEPDGVALG